MKKRSRWGYMAPEILMGAEPRTLDAVHEQIDNIFPDSEESPVRHQVHAFVECATWILRAKAARSRALAFGAGLALGAVVCRVLEAVR